MRESGRVKRFKAFFRHAFADPSSAPLTPEDLALIDEVAHMIVKRGLSVPSLIFLESFRPLNFVASQAVYALAPGFGCLFDPDILGRLGRVLEKRESVDRLMERIQEEEKSVK